MCGATWACPGICHQALRTKVVLAQADAADDASKKESKPAIRRDRWRRLAAAYASLAAHRPLCRAARRAALFQLAHGHVGCFRGSADRCVSLPRKAAPTSSAFSPKGFLVSTSSIDLSLPSRRRVVVITGASAGVGRAVACEFARHGLACGAAGTRHRWLGRRKSRCGTARRHRAGAADRRGGCAAVEAAAERVEAEWGPIDVWGQQRDGDDLFVDRGTWSAADFQRATEVTYLGTVVGTQAALKRMKPRKPRAPSCKSARRFLTGRFRCRRRTAVRKRRCAVLQIRCVLSWWPNAATCTSRLRRCRHSTHRSLIGAAPHCRVSRNRWARFLQPEVAARAFTGLRRTVGCEVWIGLPAA